MSLFKENLICSEECSYLVAKNSYYNSYSYKLEDLNLTYSCIYFVLELKPYPKNGVSAYESEAIQSIAKRESQIIIVNNSSRVSST